MHITSQLTNGLLLYKVLRLTCTLVSEYKAIVSQHTTASYKSLMALNACHGDGTGLLTNPGNLLKAASKKL
jgi:hypothetical protein